WGHRVAVAHTVASALALCRDQFFDLLVADIELPDGDGCDVLRTLHDTCGLRGIAVTGHGRPDDLQRCRDAGFHSVLVKPTPFAALRAAIDAVGESPPPASGPAPP